MIDRVEIYEKEHPWFITITCRGGFRLAKKNFDAAGTLTLTTWYIRDASGNVLSIYEQEANQEIVQTEIPIYGSGKLATVYPQQDGTAAYEITDHLGNVRALVKEQVTVYTATMEDNGQADITNPRVQELAYFENLFETEVNDPNMNHTPDDATLVPNPSKSAYLYWVSGTPGMDAIDKAVGPAIALKVNAGDTIKAEAYVRYRNETSFTRSGFTLSLLSSLLGNSFAFTGGFEGANTAQTTQSFSNALVSGGFLGDGTDDTRPYAYLNYIVLDANYARVNSGWQRVTEAAEFFPGEEGLPDMHEKVRLTAPVVIGPTGKYVYVWVSNESQGARVWFDDVTVTHTSTYIAQATDYGVWGDVLREQKANSLELYRYGYQGNFSEHDEETNWNHYELREWDAITGRWLVPDPKRQHYSPYVGMSNNPVTSTDPDGGNDIYFNKDGSYARTVDRSWFFELFFGHRGFQDQGNGTFNSISFNDQADALKFGEGGIYGGISEISNGQVKSMVSEGVDNFRAMVS